MRLLHSTSLVVLAALLSAPVFAAWPEIASPPGARVESIGEQVRLNGIPMRMYSVVVEREANDVLAFYRAGLGPRLAEKNLGHDRILSQARGDHFITVRIRPLSPKRSLALVAISDAKAARQAAHRDPGFRLPANSALLSDMESVDAGKRSRQLVLQNRLGLKANQAALTQQLAERGYRPSPQSYRSSNNSVVQLFDGDRREAQLVLVHQQGLTQIVLTTLQTP